MASRLTSRPCPSAASRRKTWRRNVCCESVSPPTLASPTSCAAATPSIPCHSSSRRSGSAIRASSSRPGRRIGSRLKRRPCDEPGVQIRGSTRSRKLAAQRAVRVGEAGRLGRRAEELDEVSLRVDRQHRDAQPDRLLGDDLGHPGLAAAGRADDRHVRRQGRERQAHRRAAGRRRPDPERVVAVGCWILVFRLRSRPRSPRRAVGPAVSRTPTAGSAAADAEVPAAASAQWWRRAPSCLGPSRARHWPCLSHLQCGHHEGSPGGLRPVPLASS